MVFKNAEARGLQANGLALGQCELGDPFAGEFDLEVLPACTIEAIEFDAGGDAEGQDTADAGGNPLARSAIDHDFELVRTGERHHLGALAQVACAMLQMVVAHAQPFTVDPAMEEVHRPEKAVHEGGRRVAVDLCRGADLLDMTVIINPALK